MTDIGQWINGLFNLPALQSPTASTSQPASGGTTNVSDVIKAVANYGSQAKTTDKAQTGAPAAPGTADAPDTKSSGLAGTMAELGDFAKAIGELLL